MDTISRQAAIERIVRIRPATPKQSDYSHGVDVGMAMAIVAIKEQPSAEPEIIRCKDCKYFAGEGMYCVQDIIVQYDHFYCYYAERREDE